MEKKRTIVKIKITENTTGEELFLAVWQAHGDAVGEPERAGWTAGRDYPFIWKNWLFTISQNLNRIFPSRSNAVTRYTKICQYMPYLIVVEEQKNTDWLVSMGDSNLPFATYECKYPQTIRKQIADAYRENAVEVLEDDNAGE